MCGRRIPMICGECGELFGCGNGRICSTCPEHANCVFKELWPEHQGKSQIKTCPDCLPPIPIQSSAKPIMTDVPLVLSPA